MSYKKINLLGVSISQLSKEEVLEKVQNYLTAARQSSPRPYTIVTPNTEQLVYAQRDESFRDILNRADVAIPDSLGVVAGLRTMYPNITIKRIAGIDLMEALVSMASEQGLSVGLIGGRQGIAVRAFECLQERYPTLLGSTIGDVEVTNRGEEGNDTKILRYKDTKRNEEKMIKGATVFSLISQYLGIFPRPLVLFIGLGAPKQEYFMEKFKIQSLKFKVPLVLMVVGGSFDILSGHLPRAPKPIQGLGLEWLWRLFQEPWRLGRQQRLLTFLSLLVKEILRKRSPSSRLS